MRRVILESPYAGDRPRNIEYAQKCLLDCLRRNEAPIASHLLFTQPGVLDDDLFAHKELGVKAGLAWVPVAEAMVVYIDYGISSGMQRAMNVAAWANIKIEKRTLYGAPPLVLPSNETTITDNAA